MNSRTPLDQLNNTTSDRQTDGAGERRTTRKEQKVANVTDKAVTIILINQHEFTSPFNSTQYILQVTDRQMALAKERQSREGGSEQRVAGKAKGGASTLIWIQRCEDAGEGRVTASFKSSLYIGERRPTDPTRLAALLAGRLHGRRKGCMTGKEGLVAGRFEAGWMKGGMDVRLEWRVW